MASDAFHGALMNETAITAKAVDFVLAEKQILVRKSGVLEFVNTQADSWEIGGSGELEKMAL